jgi:hypothetical protein
MAKRTRIYKLDITEIEESIALANVTDNLDAEASIRMFCNLFNLELDESKVKQSIQKFQVVAQALKTAQSKK